MFPITVGLNHRTAPVEIREKVSFHPSQVNKALAELNTLSALNGVVLLNTCNRLEIYAATPEVESGVSAIRSFLARHGNLQEEDLNQYLYVHGLYESVRHLFRVVAGLDSMVMGETQILGQVAEAYERSSQMNASNKVIHTIFQNALAIGKRVRAETQIDQHPTSVSYTAVELAKQTFGDVKDKSILIMGAGEMSALTAKHLVANGASTVMVSNRSFQRAQALAEEFSGKAIPYEDIDTALVETDIVISATAANHFVILPERMRRVMKLREYRSLLMIDIAVPRDIHPGVNECEGVTLFDIDDLRGVVDAHQKAREEAAIQAEKILEEEMSRFKKWHNSLFVVPTIIALQRRGEQVRDVMVKNALNKLGPIDAKQEKVIRTMANSIITHLLHQPIANLKEVAHTSQGHLYTEILQNLFDLDVDQESPHAGRSVHHAVGHHSNQG
ncbi:glutamyl-tRNA reductase [Desulfitobacterium sp. THU1]|uniref:glutamyl-tRNA reductase n=1 Tax=Desulfitobacterium sp. THU1 TaxID=3138072 RepID=UPI00311E41C6